MHTHVLMYTHLPLCPRLHFCLPQTEKRHSRHAEKEQKCLDNRYICTPFAHNKLLPLSVQHLRLGMLDRDLVACVALVFNAVVNG